MDQGLDYLIKALDHIATPCVYNHHTEEYVKKEGENEK